MENKNTHEECDEQGRIKKQIEYDYLYDELYEVNIREYAYDVDGALEWIIDSQNKAHLNDDLETYSYELINMEKFKLEGSRIRYKYTYDKQGNVKNKFEFVYSVDKNGDEIATGVITYEPFYDENDINIELADEETLTYSEVYYDYGYEDKEYDKMLLEELVEMEKTVTNIKSKTHIVNLEEREHTSEEVVEGISPNKLLIDEVTTEIIGAQEKEKDKNIE